MSIILSKNLKQKQSVKLTPSLKKSIDLLQLSRFELIKKIDKEIIENPFLEKNDANNDYEDFNHSDFSFDIESKVNLRESLITQLDDFHLNEKEIKIAKLIITSGNIYIIYIFGSRRIGLCAIITSKILYFL